MLKNKINFGILGCGMIADFHAQAVRSIEQAALFGVADNDTERAQDFAAKYNTKAYDNYAQMLADSEIDAICICTPSGFHAQNAIDALMAGKNVVIEKPMAINSEDAQKITDICNESNLCLTVISQLRFSEDVNRVKQLVAENAFGKLVFCDLYMKYWRSQEYYSSSKWKGTVEFDGGGALMNQGIHGVDLLLYIAGDAKVLKAQNRTVFHSIEVEDASVALLEFQNGALGVIEASTCAYPGFERKIEIMGTEGCAVLRENKLEKLVVRGETLIDEAVQAVSGTSSNPAAMSYTLHAAQIRNFIGAIKGENQLLIDSAQGQRAVSLIEKIYKS